MKHYTLSLSDDDGTVLDTWHVWTDHPHPTPKSIRWLDDGPHQFVADPFFTEEQVCLVCCELIDSPAHTA